MFCKYCGNKLDSDAKFCAGCGKKLTEEGPVKNNEQHNTNKKYIYEAFGIVLNLIGFFAVAFCINSIHNDFTAEGMWWDRYDYVFPLTDHEMEQLIRLALSACMMAAGVILWVIGEREDNG